MNARRGYKSAAKPAGSLQLTIVLLALAGLVVVATLYYVFRSPPEVGPPDGSDDPHALARELRAKVETAIRDFDETAGSESEDVQALRRMVLEEWRKRCREYLAKDPMDIIVRPALARLLLRLGDLAAAERAADALLRLAPESPEAFWIKGLVRVRRGDAAGLDYLRRAAESDQAAPIMWMHYGEALAESGRREAAGRWLGKVLEARRGRPEGLGRSDLPLLRRLADMAAAEGRHDEAAGILADLLRIDPDDMEAALKRAASLRLAGRLDEAEEQLTAVAARTRPGGKPAASVAMERGRLAEARGQWPAAARAYAAAAGHPSHHAEGALQAAISYYRAGRYALAMEQIDAAAEVVPEDRRVRKWIGKIEDARFGPPATRPGR